MKFENTEVWGFEHAIRGMRNPHDSWNISDSYFGVKVRGTGAPVGNSAIIKEDDNGFIEYAVIGPKDLKLAKTLIRSGSEHRKFLRQIFVSVDITAALYWWKQFDQYKVGVTSDSCSTMHTLHKTPITMDCFEMDDFSNVSYEDKGIDISTKMIWEAICWDLEKLRLKYRETNDKRYWKELIRLLPESWLQKRTITFSYENVLNMVQQRVPEKLDDWHKYFFPWAHTLPYADELLFVS